MKKVLDKCLNDLLYDKEKCDCFFTKNIVEKHIILVIV